MKYDSLKKRVLENVGTYKHTSDKQTDIEIEFAKTITDEDIKQMEKEAQMVNFFRKPRIYVIAFIFFRYQIPVMFYRAVNFITGV